ncbi:transcriptional coactivator p15/PC4 family protein [Paraburkholderia bannensis]|uniref:transcriptional coactivator p15/PC4 family protein n=1 Tax=Paraburkholderia bannensis TaxID=765414 RepID=UPI002AC34341|nr:transcriptional coactivator p15/PC4 family protein [Paraburkholderia bannensis]
MQSKKIAHQGKTPAGPNDRNHDSAAATKTRQDGDELAQNDTLIAEVQKNSRERLRVTVGEYKGHQYVGARLWFVGTDGQYRPSRSGFNLRPELVPELIQALGLAARAADPNGAR